MDGQAPCFHRASHRGQHLYKGSEILSTTRTGPSHTRAPTGLDEGRQISPSQNPRASRDPQCTMTSKWILPSCATKRTHTVKQKRATTEGNPKMAGSPHLGWPFSFHFISGLETSTFSPTSRQGPPPPPNLSFTKGTVGTGKEQSPPFPQ